MRNQTVPSKRAKKAAAMKRLRMRGEKGKMYVNFDETGGCYVYVGGRFYQNTAQIHLSRDEAIALRVWLNKYVRGRK